MKESEPGKKGTGKARRVSHRRELAVVTLAAVASISGVGGLLAAKPPASQSNQPAGAGEQAALGASARPDGGRSVVPVSFNGGYGGDDEYHEGDDEYYEEDYEDEQATVQPASTRPAQKVAPSWSAPSQTPASAVSQGS